MALINSKIGSAILLLDKKTRLHLAAATLIRILLNLLDLAALAVVGVVGFLIANPKKDFEFVLPVFGREIHAAIGDVPVLAILATALFVIKTVSSSIFSFTFARHVSRLETKFSEQWLEFYFGNVNEEDYLPDGPDIQNTLLRSMNALVTGVLTSIVTLASEGTLLLALVCGFILLNPLGAVLVISYLSLIVIALSRFILPRVQKASAVDYSSSRQLMALTRDYVSNRKSIYIHGMNSQWIGEVTDAKRKQIEGANRGVSLTTLPRNLIEAALILGVFGFLGLVMLFSDIPSQAVTIGVFLVGGLRLVSAVLPLQAASGVLKQSLTAVDDALAGLKGRAIQSTFEAQNPDDLALKVIGLGYRHQGSNFELRTMDFDVPFGSKLAIVGPSGAGKSTLGELLIGLRRPTSGDVLIGGVPASKLIQLKGNPFAYVPQSSQLIDGTFAENVTFSRTPDEAQRLKILEVLQACGLSSLLERLPDGLDSQLSVGQANLSGGEIQRLGLARALFTDPKILVLDEATSALDAATEEFISATFKSFHGRSTLIVIAHRLSTILDADCILYLNGGNLVAKGTYQELITHVPDFKEAVRILSTKTGK